MSVKVATNRFIVSSLKRYGGFYQQLINRASFQELGDRLARQAEIAYWFRQSAIVEEAGLMLSNLPLKEYQLIGQYYLGWCAYRRGEDAQSIFENVAENSITYKAKGLISLAASEVARNDFDSALNLCQEVTKQTENPSLLLTAARSVAFLKSMEGDHHHALKDLERLAPLARYASPVAYYNYLNSLAVELAEAGRLEEASNISNIVLASPLAFAYPEWRETGDEIRLKLYRSHSIISVTQVAPRNVVSLPERSNKVTESTQQPGKLLSYTDWTNKMVKEPNGNDELDFSKMSDKDKLFKIIELSSTEDITDDQLDQILDAVIRITSKRT
jgi:tetratricopeptide (TPR) repeat protein